MTTAAQGGGSFPLTQDHYHAMNGVLETVHQALPIMEKCVNCGLPVQGDIETLQQRAQFATDVKRNFFPELP